VATVVIGLGWAGGGLFVYVVPFEAGVAVELAFGC
jgi:hypothetical protein